LGNQTAYPFPRSKIHDDHFDFSFSGLKTAVRYAVMGPGKQDFEHLNISDAVKADVCASFEAAVVDVLVTKATKAVKKYGVRQLCVGGGVAANRVLRHSLQASADRFGFRVTIAPPELCTDNAVMGAIAWEKIHRGEFASLDLDIQPGLQRGY
jgi:N6-L-threonylcarbamoyladenine synthase